MILRKVDVAKAGLETHNLRSEAPLRGLEGFEKKRKLMHKGCGVWSGEGVARQRFTLRFLVG